MSSEESRSPTFDGNETAEQTGQTADVSGIQRDRTGQGKHTPEQESERPRRPDEAAQVVP
jgi:hypothetical protein